MKLEIGYRIKYFSFPFELFIRGILLMRGIRCMCVTKPSKKTFSIESKPPAYVSCTYRSFDSQFKIYCVCGTHFNYQFKSFNLSWNFNVQIKFKIGTFGCQFRKWNGQMNKLEPSFYRVNHNNINNSNKWDCII